MGKACLLLAIACAALTAQTGDAEKLAPYYPTPETIVDKMLKLGELRAGEKMYDLGSGDGRIGVCRGRFAGLSNPGYIQDFHHGKGAQ